MGERRTVDVDQGSLADQSDGETLCCSSEDQLQRFEMAGVCGRSWAEHVLLLCRVRRMGQSGGRQLLSADPSFVLCDCPGLWLCSRQLWFHCKVERKHQLQQTHTRCLISSTRANRMRSCSPPPFVFIQIFLCLWPKHGRHDCRKNEQHSSRPSVSQRTSCTVA